MNKFVMAMTLGLVGCATPGVPYVSEYRVGDQPRDWASRNRTSIKVVTVHNPYPCAVDITVHCYGGYFFDGKTTHTFEKVAAGGEDRGMITVRSSDAIVGVCEVLNNPEE